MKNRNRLWDIDHSPHCDGSAGCDCPTLGEMLAEAEEQAREAATEPLPPWMTEDDRGAVVRWAAEELAALRSRLS